MRLIDMHCDTIWKLEQVERGSDGESPQCESLYHNTGMLDIAGMKEAGTIVQFFANFIYMDWYGHDWDKGYDGALHMMARAKAEIEAAKADMQLLTSYERGESGQKIGAFLTIEEGGILNGEMERLQHLYEQGIRLLTLTWNDENCIGFPASDTPELMNKGLKLFGIEAIEEMNRLGMIVDVSHLSDGGFWDVIGHSRKPIAASHSNTRALCNVRRNLTDDMLRALGENGGVAGVNFFPLFVQKEGTCTAKAIAAHVLHMIQIGGENLPVVGTDFDGYDIGESEINHVCQMDLFYDALKKAGLSNSQIEKVCYKNAENLMRENL